MSLGLQLLLQISLAVTTRMAGGECQQVANKATLRLDKDRLKSKNKPFPEDKTLETNTWIHNFHN